MIRVALVLVVIAALAVAATAVIGEPGHATLAWLGGRIDMTGAAAVMLVTVGALVAIIFWRTAIWMLQAPARARAANAAARRRQGGEALSRGFLALASGDGPEARRAALKAADLVEDSPALVRVLSAHAAEACGDTAAAQAAYTAMLGFPDMKLAGHRGLMLLALAQGDKAQALSHAGSAYGMARTARWAWTALLEARLETADWPGALELIKGAQDRKIIPPIAAERTRAALLTAQAASLEAAGDPRAADPAVEAAKSKPGFAPGVALAARLLAADDKRGRAAGLIEAGWRASPHPALWLAWRGLQTGETPAQRAQRLQSLADLNPTHPESHVVVVEQALITGDPRAARAAAEPLLAEPPTARICAVMARVAFANGDADEARAWIARAAAAPPDADWSDIDPDGRAFPYSPGDWARLAAAYGETGELIHPRLERGERTISELPQLPRGYQASTPFLRAAEAGSASGPLPDDPGPQIDAEAEPSDAPALRPRARGPRPAGPT